MLGGVYKWWTLLSLFGSTAADAAAVARPAFDRLSVLRGGAAEQAKTGKVWVTSTFTRDHVRFAWELPGYLGAYVNPLSACDPKTIESVMCTVNSINTCPYCTGLHGTLARMASVDKMEGPAVEFAKVFATEGGRGAAVQKAFDKLVAAEGVGRAKNIRALCWALLWGKTTGNSINVVRGKLLSGKLWKLTPFDLIMFAFYGPLFLIIGVMNAGLQFAPNVRQSRAQRGRPRLAHVVLLPPLPCRWLPRLHVRRVVLLAGAAVVLDPLWRHPLVAADASHSACGPRLPRAPRARGTVWRPQPLGLLLHSGRGVERPTIASSLAACRAPRPERGGPLSHARAGSTHACTVV